MKTNFDSLILISLALQIIVISECKAQSTFEHRIATNVFGFPFNDFSLYYQVTTDKHSRISLSGGYMIASRWWNAETGTTGDIEVNDDKYPIGSYNGPQLRFGYFKGKSIQDRIKYRGPQVVLKYLYYTDQNFVDWFSHDDKVPVRYIRSENAFVVGAEWVMQKENPKKKYFIQTFWSFGFRVKFREINTTKNTTTYFLSPANARPVGFKRTTLFIPTINFGIMLGSKFTSKDKNQ